MLTNRNGIHKIFCRVRVLIKLQIAVNCSKNRIRQSFYYSPDVNPSTDYRITLLISLYLIFKYTDFIVPYLQLPMCLVRQHCYMSKTVALLLSTSQWTQDDCLKSRSQSLSLYFLSL